MKQVLKELKLLFVKDKIDFYFLIYSIILVLFLSVLASTLGFWSDEGFTLLVSQRSVYDIINFTINDTNPPLYYILIKFWAQIFGYNEFTIRFFSILSFFFSIYLLKNIIIRSQVVLQTNINLLLLLVSVSPVMIFFALEARFYAFVTLLFLIFLNSALDFNENTTNKNLIFLIIAAVVGLYTHSIFVVTIGSFSFITFIKIASKYFQRLKEIQIHNIFKNLIDDIFLKKFIIYNFSVLILYLPWLFVIINTAKSVTDSFWLKFDPIFSLLEYQQASIIAENYIDSEQIFTFRVILMVLTGVLFTLGIINIFKQPNQRLKNIIWMFLVPLLFAYLISTRSAIFYFRYLSFLTPIVYLIIYFGIQDFSDLFNSKLKKVLLPMFVLIVSIMNFSWFYFAISKSPGYKINSKEITEQIAFSFNPKTDIVVTPSLSNYTNTKYYFNQNHPQINIRVYDPNKVEPLWTGTGLLKENEYISKTEILQSQRVWITYQWGEDRVEELLESKNYLKISDKTIDYQKIQLWQK